MFGLFGVEVLETKDTIIVRGIPGKSLDKFITHHWKTSIIAKQMFKRLNGGRFGVMEFYKFFLIDVIYMLEKLATVKNGKVPARTCHLIAEKLKEVTWYKDTQDTTTNGRLDFSKLKLFNFIPLDIQQKFFEYYDKVPNQYHLRGALLAIAMGGGKSFTATAALELAGVDRIIVVCPKITIDKVWRNDPQLFYKNPPKSFNSLSPSGFDKDTRFFVYHYEALERCLSEHQKDFGKYRYGIILDECHNMNEVKTQRTQLFLQLVKESQSNNIIFSSGTPLKAMGYECIPLLRSIDPYFTQQAEERFRKIYGVNGTRGLDILKNRLGLVSYKVEKSQLGLQPPEISTLGIQIKNGNAYTLTAVKAAMAKFIEERVKYYKSREKDDIRFYQECLSIHESKLRSPKEKAEFVSYKKAIQVIQSTTEYHLIKDQTMFAKQYEQKVISTNLPQPYVKPFREVCSIIKYLTLKIQGECLGNVVGRMRIDAHREMTKAIPFLDICESTQKKTVVFTSFVDVLQDAMNACKEQGLNPILVYGKTSKDVSPIVSKFEQDEGINPLIATYNSLSTGVPLVMADTMIMINAPFRSYIQDQAIARIHRLRQDSQTRVIQCYLDTGNEPNISTRSLDIMTWSQQQVEAMTGVKSPYTIDDTTEGEIIVATESLDDSLTIKVSSRDIELESVSETTISSRFNTRHQLHHW